MVKLVPLSIDHIAALKQMDGLFQNFDMQVNAPALLYAGAGFTLLEDDQVVTCGGVIPRWRGVGELWIAVGAAMKNRPLTLVRQTHKVIAMLEVECGFNRLQLHIESDNPGLTRWAEALGFTFEGRMIKYGIDGKDHDLFARTH